MVDEDGTVLGIFDTSKALSMAVQRSLDLVEVSPNASPPVCKMMNYSKYKYDQQKKSREAHKKQRLVELKEIKVRPNIASGDYEVKKRAAQRFLADGNKVKISLIFRGREASHDKVGFALIRRFIDDLIDFGRVEMEPRLEGRQIIVVIAPSGPAAAS